MAIELAFEGRHIKKGQTHRTAPTQPYIYSNKNPAHQKILMRWIRGFVGAV